MRTRKLGALAVALLVLSAFAAGCGSGDAEYANADRPPAPVSISVALIGGRVAVSPSHVGGGPVVLLIANESDRSRDVTLTAAGGGRSCVAEDASSGPVNPQGNARMSLALVEGVCEVSVADGDLASSRLTVGPQRDSAQQDLLQP